jgi:hypothetical protein
LASSILSVFSLVMPPRRASKNFAGALSDRNRHYSRVQIF